MSLPSLLAASSGALSGVLAMSALYPLENLRIRMQVQVQRARADDSAEEARESARAHDRTTWECFRRVLREEGWRGLYRGECKVLRAP
jgi:hypothetical protein